MMNRLVDEQMQRMEAESEVTELKTALKKARAGKGGDDSALKELESLRVKYSEYLAYGSVSRHKLMPSCTGKLLAAGKIRCAPSCQSVRSDCCV
jgi:hypothetical protein